MRSLASDDEDDKASLEAVSRIKAWLRKNANLDDIPAEEVADSAWERWFQERKNTPEQYAIWELGSFRKKANRRQTTVDSDAVDLAGAEGATVEDLFTAEPVDRAGPRVRRFKEDTPEFRAAVRAECLEKFRERLGKEWDPALEKQVVTDSADWDDLEEAHEVHEQLRQAMLRAVKFVQRKRKTLLQPAPLGLSWWVADHIVPLTSHAMFEEKKRHPAGQRATTQHESPRHRLVATWDSFDFLGIQREDGHGSRALDATEFAIVWLLGGGWPRRLTFRAEGLTPSEVIQTEARTFRAAIEEVGRNWLRGPG